VSTVGPGYAPPATARPSLLAVASAGGTGVQSAPSNLDRPAVVLDSLAALQEFALRLDPHRTPSPEQHLHIADPRCSARTARAAAAATGATTSVAGHVQLFRPGTPRAGTYLPPLVRMGQCRALLAAIHADLHAASFAAGDTVAPVLPLDAYRRPQPPDDVPAAAATALLRTAGDRMPCLAHAGDRPQAPRFRPLFEAVLRDSDAGQPDPDPLLLRPIGSAAGPPPEPSPYEAPGRPASVPQDPESQAVLSAAANALDAVQAATEVRLDPATRVRTLQAALEQARLAQDVYDPSLWIPHGSRGVPGWRDISRDASALRAFGLTPHDLQPEPHGFRARLYLPDPATLGDDAKPQLVFKGTDPSVHAGRDWLNNLQQGLGLPSHYYGHAIDIALRLRANGARIELVGHSLGGGMAALAAVASGLPATTFNAAGLHGKTLRQAQAEQDPARIQAYAMRGDWLTGLQETDLRRVLEESRFGRLMLPAHAWLRRLAGEVIPPALGTPHELLPPTRHGHEESHIRFGRFTIALPPTLSAHLRRAVPDFVLVALSLHMMSSVIERLEADLEDAQAQA
jgi:hypothetical protein